MSFSEIEGWMLMEVLRFLFCKGKSSINLIPIDCFVQFKLFRDNMDPTLQKEPMMQSDSLIGFNPITFVLQFLATYGWYLVGACVAAMYVLQKLRPKLDKWREAREDAEYHKDPDMALARMEAIQRAREKQQQLLIEASERALEQQKEREERKRQEMAERLKKYGSAAGGQRLGSEDDYLPLSGGASTSSYRPPKRSKCGGGGCGK